MSGAIERVGVSYRHASEPRRRLACLLRCTPGTLRAWQGRSPDASGRKTAVGGTARERPPRSAPRFGCLGTQPRDQPAARHRRDHHPHPCRFWLRRRAHSANCSRSRTAYRSTCATSGALKRCSLWRRAAATLPACTCLKASSPAPPSRSTLAGCGRASSASFTSSPGRWGCSWPAATRRAFRACRSSRAPMSFSSTARRTPARDSFSIKC